MAKISLPLRDTKTLNSPDILARLKGQLCKEKFSHDAYDDPIS